MTERSPRRVRKFLSLLPNGVTRAVVYFLGLALTAQLLHAVVESPRDEVLPVQEPAIDLVDNPIPSPSGADPLYPPNHTFDGKTTALGNVTNHDFEAAPAAVGTPATNHDIETAPTTVGTFTNGDFETGDFTGWTLAGSPTIASDPNQGYYARFTGSTHKITSSAVTVPSSAQALVYDIGYLNPTSYSWIKVYVLTGATYGTATLLRNDNCNSCGYWSTSYVDLTAYRTQSVKFRFDLYSSGHPAGIDNVKIQEVFSGWEATGTYARRTSGGDSYYEGKSGSLFTSSAFTVDAQAQYGLVQVKTGGGSSAQYEVYVAVGPSFSTYTRVTFGYAPTDWTTARFDIAPYRDQQIKVRFKPIVNTVLADDIGVQRVEVQGWEVTSSATWTSDGSGGHYVSSDGTLVSSAFAIPAGTQNLKVRARSSGTSTTFSAELLTGANFSTVVHLDDYTADGTWATYRFGASPYSGQTAKLRLTKTNGPAMHLEDAGQAESVLPGWTMPRSEAGGTDAVVTGTDASGGFATSPETAGSLWLRSDWLSSGIVDVAGSTQYRYYSVAYDIGYSGSNILSVHWVNDQGQGWNVYTDAAGSPTGYKVAWFRTFDFVGARGYLEVRLANGGKVYSIADNTAQEHLSEPFSRTAGLGIDTTTGALAFNDADVSVPGPIPISFTRTFNGHSDRIGPLGWRWNHTFETNLVFDDDDNAGVVFGSGRQEFFDKDISGDFSAVDPRVQSSLVGNVDGTFDLKTKDNLTYRFTAAGRLTSITDLNANQLALAYDGQGRLSTVTGDGGVAITLAYDAQSRLSTLTDPATAVWTYGYDAAGDLKTVTDPEGGVRTYAYADHRLTSVTDEAGHVEQANTYDDMGRVTSQTDAANKTITVAYATPGQGATRVTDPEGGQATYHFDRFARTTHAVDPTGKVISYLFDANGQLDKVIDPIGNEWNFAFDAAGDLTSANDPLGNPASFTWSPKHLPQTVTDARGKITTYAYDAQGNMTSVTDPLNHTTTYTHDASGNVLTETNPLNQTTTYTYDSRGNRLTKTDPRNKTWTWTYDSANRMITETDPLNHTTTYGYDSLSRLDQITDHLGHETTFWHDLPGHLLKQTNPLGKETTWTYDDRGLVATKTDARGKVTTYGYDANRNMTSVTDPNSNTTTYGYDDANRLVSITNPLNKTTAYTYDSAGRLASVTDPLNRVTSYAYDSAGRLTTTTLPNNGTIVRAYDPNGNLTSLTDPLTNVETRTYDDANRLTSVTDALNKTTTYGYDNANRFTSVTDPLNQVTTYGYDDAGNRTSVTDALNHATTSAYDDAGRLASVTDPTNRVTSYGYDAVDRLTTITAPGGGVTTYAYDADDRLTSVTSPTNGVTSYTYGPTDLLLTETDPLNHTTTYTYDDAGRQLTATDPLNHTTTYGNDAADRLTSITDALNGVVSFGYDAAGQRTSLTDQRNKTWTYLYDALGNRRSVTDPLGRETTWTFDAEGAPTSQTDPRNITTSYGYDAVGQLTSVTYPGGSVGHVYDDAGRRTSMTDATGTTTWGYDNADRITSVAQPAGTLTYAYDDAGRRTSMTLPGSRQVTYAYDTAGRLSNVTDWGGRWAEFGYDSAGRRTSISRSNGVSSTSVYDAAGQVTSIVHAAAGNTLQSFAYTYDAAGNRATLTSPQGNETYSYDALDRLSDVAYQGGPTVGYTYDAAGNRTSETRGGQTTNYTYDNAGQLTQVGSETYTYDGAGNLTAAGQDTYAWDYANRLTSVSRDGHTATYTYDGTGVKTRAVVDGDTDELLIDRARGLPAIVDDGEHAYVHAAGPAWQTSAGGTEFALLDGLRSVRGLTSGTGTLVGSTSYEAFGASRSSSGSSTLFGFTGEPLDATGMVDLRARALEPGVGRFFSADTVRPNAPGGQGFNLYSYVANNPATWLDPTGHTTGLLEREAVEVIAEITKDTRMAQPRALTACLAVILGHIRGNLLTCVGVVFAHLMALVLVSAALFIGWVILTAGFADGPPGGHFPSSDPDLKTESPANLPGTGAGAGGVGGGSGPTPPDPCSAPPAYDPEGGTTRVYRVEAEAGKNTHIGIASDGLVTVGGSGMLHLNFGDYDRAIELFAKRLGQYDDTVLRTFEVYDSYVDYLRRCAKNQDEAGPDDIQRDDYPRYKDQYGLPESEWEFLRQNIVPFSGILVP
jgi:RHS repeat-associated protein